MVVARTRGDVPTGHRGGRKGVEEVRELTGRSKETTAGSGEQRSRRITEATIDGRGRSRRRGRQRWCDSGRISAWERPSTRRRASRTCSLPTRWPVAAWALRRRRRETNERL